MVDERYLLTFIVTLEARDKVIDLLMGDDSVGGFTATDSQGFSREHSAYDIGEQIAGFRRVSRFEIVGPRDALLALRRKLKEQALLSSGAPAWITPIE
ncbi:MAG: DUF3240 family protein [Halieaceae bacterium]|jgi:hypothetical protein|nr:DUF3240 family protein [Halieaceae bacterium]